MEENRGVADGGEIGLEVADGGGGYMGSGRCGSDVKEGCGRGANGGNGWTTVLAERGTAMRGAGRERGRGARLHASSPGSDRGGSVGPAAGCASTLGVWGRGHGREGPERALFVGRGKSEEGIVGFDSGREVQRHDCGAIRDVWKASR